MSAHNWKPRKRKYRIEKRELISPEPATEWHPLSEKKRADSRPSKPIETITKKAKDVHDPLSSTSLDPLSSLLSSGSDPLSSTSTDPLNGKTKERKEESVLFEHSSSKRERKEMKEIEEIDDEEKFSDWSARKKGVLLEFTADEAIGIEVDFMETSKKVLGGEEQQEARLAELDETDESAAKEVLKLTQKEYVSHIEKLHSNLQRAWENEQRVKSLKIAIQCAKVLSDTSVIKFYPSKFVLISEILDTFGKLVYKRIFDRSVTYTTSGAPIYLPEKFSPEEVTDLARETCRNWFFKIASIRELLPRLYVETAIIKCYCFLSHGAYIEVINRLNTMIRGVGDPLVATYLRVYLARKAWEVEPATKEFLLAGFNDYIFTFESAMAKKSFRAMIETHRLSTMEYVNLYSPALEYLLESIAYKAQPKILDKVMIKYRESKNLLVLYHLIKAFKPEMIATHAKGIATFVKEVPENEKTYPKYKLYVVLGNALSKAAPVEEHRLPILNEVWKVVRKMKDPVEYMSCAEAWIAYPSKHLSHREVNTLLGDILKHVKENNAYENLQPQLAKTVKRVAKHLKDFSVVTSMTNFLPVMDLITGSHKVNVAYCTLNAFAKSSTTITTRDPVIINTLFSVGKTLHDSVNTLTFFDDIRKYSEAISQFIQKIEYGKQLDKHLNFYVECRRAFGNLDKVKSHLVLGVCNLAMKTLHYVNGKHTKKTAAFARACVAYCFITIPTMDDYFTRLYLYLITAQVALVNQSLPQAEALLKAAITLVQDVPLYTDKDHLGGREVKPTQDSLVGFVRNFAAVLVATPGHPEYGPFYLAKGLLKVLQEYPWEVNTLGKARCFMAMLSMFTTQAQEDLPYTIPGVESNDVLYAGDSAFQKELNALIDKIIEVVLSELAELKKDETHAGKKKFGELSVELFECTITHAELNASTATLAANLFKAAKKSGVNSNTLKNCLKSVQTRGVVDPFASKVATQLYEKLS